MNENVYDDEQTMLIHPKWNFKKSQRNFVWFIHTCVQWFLSTNE
jgi:hypothetical protein